MNRKFLCGVYFGGAVAILALWLFQSGPQASAQDPIDEPFIGDEHDGDEPEPQRVSKPATTGWGDVKVKPQAINPAGIRAERMTLRQRRELGLTFSNVRRVVRDLHKAGEVDSNSDPAIVSMMVAEQLMMENPTVYSQLSPQFDWDSFLAFVEKIVELVMRIISLFSYVVPAEAEGLASTPSSTMIHAPPVLAA